jgi:hypothetical protein
MPKVVAWIGCIALLAGCGDRVRPSEDIFEDQLALPAVYLTEKTHKKIIAPQGKGKFIDEKTGETCWRALTCHNPDCPREPDGDEPFLFLETDTGTTACPKCLTKRNLKTETPRQKQQYVNWVRPYVLPETAKRQKELDEERRKLIEAMNKR